MLCPHCGTEFDGTGTCMFDCMSDWCGRCGQDVEPRKEHRCPERRKFKGTKLTQRPFAGLTLN